MKIVNYLEDNDPLAQLRGIEVYPFLEPHERASIDANYQVYKRHDNGHINIRNNCASGLVTLEQAQEMLTALSLALALAMQWEQELTSESEDIP